MTSTQEAIMRPAQPLTLETQASALEGGTLEPSAPGSEKAPIDLKDEDASSEGDKPTRARKPWPEGLQ
jgi:hypothetical protein